MKPLLTKQASGLFKQLHDDRDGGGGERRRELGDDNHLSSMATRDVDVVLVEQTASLEGSIGEQPQAVKDRYCPSVEVVGHNALANHFSFKGDDAFKAQLEEKLITDPGEDMFEFPKEESPQLGTAQPGTDTGYSSPFRRSGAQEDPAEMQRYLSPPAEHERKPEPAQKPPTPIFQDVLHPV